MPIPSSEDEDIPVTIRPPTPPPDSPLLLLATWFERLVLGLFS
jgi:hypothetical protein